MIITEVKLFRTPLSPDYKNVIDTVNFAGDKKRLVYDTLESNYSMLKVEPISKTVKRLNSNTSLTVRVGYETIRDYNYCVIIDDNQNYHFYFIVGVNSENDNSATPASSLLLRWDAWTNNIEKFKDTPQNVLLSHFDRFDIDYGNYDDVVGVTPKFYIQNLNSPIDMKYEPKFKRKYLPAFFKVTYKEMRTVPYSNSDNVVSNGLFIKDCGFDVGAVDVSIADSLNNSYNRKVVYFFAGIFDCELEEFVNGEIDSIDLTFTRKLDGATMTYNRNQFSNITFGLISSNIRFNLPSVYYQYISSIELTFNSPFNYTIDSSIPKIYFDENPLIITPFNVTSYSSGDWIPYVIVGDIVNLIPDGSGGYEFNTKRYGMYQDRVNEYSILRGELLGYNALYLDSQSFRYFDVDYLDPLNFTPPFNDLILSHNNQLMSLTRSGLKDKTINIEISSKTAQSQLVVKYGVDRVKNPSNIFINNSGYFSYGLDSLDSFYVRNNASLGFSVFNKAWKHGSKIADSENVIDAVGNLFNGIRDIMTDYYRIVDIETTPDEWFANTGECDMKYQDRVRLIHGYVDRNSPLYITVFNEAYLTGYSTLYIKSPFSNTRKSFDFCRTSNCNLSPLMLNDNDRQELEDAFNRGLTKWHILTANDTTYFTPTMIKDKETVRNYESKFITDSDLRQWIGGDL